MKTVVILQPQTGTKPRRSEREQRENIDNNATGQMTWTGRGPGPYRQRQGDTEKDVSVNLRSSGKPIDDKGYPAKRQQTGVLQGTPHRVENRKL